ncbi:MAG: hypothetical protein DRO12_05080 [Thermoprotei archaeon]|nr:MAG: hypothetical protein DRO12_05080 [Thermoprotei archaeon]
MDRKSLVDFLIRASRLLLWILLIQTLLHDYDFTLFLKLLVSLTFNILAIPLLLLGFLSVPLWVYYLIVMYWMIRMYEMLQREEGRV